MYSYKSSLLTMAVLKISKGMIRRTPTVGPSKTNSFKFQTALIHFFVKELKFWRFKRSICSSHSKSANKEIIEINQENEQ